MKQSIPSLNSSDYQQIPSQMMKIGMIHVRMSSSLILIKDNSVCKLTSGVTGRKRQNWKCQNGIYVSKAGTEALGAEGKGEEEENKELTKAGDEEKPWFRIQVKERGVGWGREQMIQRIADMGKSSLPSVH